METNSLIITKKDNLPLSKLYRQFNENVSKIESLKKEIAENKSNDIYIQSLVRMQVLPIKIKHESKMGELVKILDLQYKKKELTKKDKEKLAYFIVYLCHSLIREGQNEFKEIFDKYSSQKYDDYKLELNRSQEDSKYNDFESELNEDFDFENFTNETDPRKKKHKESENSKQKTTKQISKELKVAEELKNINKAARTIYTDLVKKFHPDREKDENEKIRKTEILKKVTSAYEKKDLFELLRLKVENFESNSSDTNYADASLKYYNKILKEQIKKLEEESWHLKYKVSKSIGLDHNKVVKITNTSIDFFFKKQLRDHKENLKLLEQNIIAFRNIEVLKDYLKYYDYE